VIREESDPLPIVPTQGLASRVACVQRRDFRRNGDNVTDPGFPIHRRPTDEDLEREAVRIRQDVVDAVDAFKRYTSEESRDLLASGRDDDELGSES
jgi:hypothetical protein